MANTLRLTLAQLNPSVGDVPGNTDAAKRAWQQGVEANSDLVVLPEMFIAGYNPQDLILKPAFIAACQQAIADLARECADGPALAIGGPCLEGDALYNAYYILQGGKISATVKKHHLPNDAVFDEKRLFTPADVTGPYTINGVRIGSPICEDAWKPDVVETLAETGAEIIVIPNGSPYDRTKQETRINLMVSRVVESGLPLVYLNMVGGQDDQVFDGGSFVLNTGGELAVQMPRFDATVTHVDFTRTEEGWRASHGEKASMPDSFESDYRAMVEGLRDYLGKTGFKKVLLGLSGGIDSAIVAAVATDALGADNVRCVMLPSEYTSEHSLEDAKSVAENLGCQYDYVPIAEGRQAITNTLVPFFEGLTPDITEENIQSRLRGLLLMALSNKFGEMLLTTGNKSEVAVGYATIYGDMNGGYNPIKDLYKTRVFAMCRWRNDNHRDWMNGPAGEVIPDRVISKPPSAELRPDQKDEDSLPPYDVLDAILEGLVDNEDSVADLVAKGYAREDVKRVEHLLFISEYKRFQSAPGTRLSPRAFWLDRRYPIANRWRDNS